MEVWNSGVKSIAWPEGFLSFDFEMSMGGLLQCTPKRREAKSSL